MPWDPAVHSQNPNGTPPLGQGGPSATGWRPAARAAPASPRAHSPRRCPTFPSTPASGRGTAWAPQGGSRQESPGPRLSPRAGNQQMSVHVTLHQLCGPSGDLCPHPRNGVPRGPPRRTNPEPWVSPAAAGPEGTSPGSTQREAWSGGPEGCLLVGARRGPPHRRRGGATLTSFTHTRAIHKRPATSVDFTYLLCAASA